MKKNYKEPKMKPFNLKGEVILAGSGVETPGIQGKSINVNDKWEVVDDANARVDNENVQYWQ